MLELFCGMHLGVNLRVIEQKGVNRYKKEQNPESEETDVCDAFVNEFCKLLSSCSEYEHGKGKEEFKDHLIESQITK